MHHAACIKKTILPHLFKKNNVKESNTQKINMPMPELPLLKHIPACKSVFFLMGPYDMESSFAVHTTLICHKIIYI